MANSEGEIFREIEEANKRAGEFLSLIEQEIHEGAQVQKKVDTFENFYEEIFDRSIDLDETDRVLTEYGLKLYRAFCNRLATIFDKEYGITVYDSDIHPHSITDYYKLYRILYLNNTKFFLDIGIGKLLAEYDKYYQRSAFYNQPNILVEKISDDEIKLKMISLYKEKALSDEDIAHKIVGLTLYDENYLDLDMFGELLLRSDSNNADYLDIFGNGDMLSQRYAINFDIFKNKLIKDYLIDNERGSTKKNITVYYLKYLENLQELLR